MSNQEQHLEQLRQEKSLYICGVREMQPARVAALDAGIAALKREGQIKIKLEQMTASRDLWKKISTGDVK